MKTNEDKKRFLEALSKTPFIVYAAKQVGIDKATIYRWKEKDKNFRKNVEVSLGYGRAGYCDAAESQLLKKVNQGDFKAIKFYLENNDKRYIKPRPVNFFVTDKDEGITLSRKRIDELNKMIGHIPDEKVEGRDTRSL